MRTPYGAGSGGDARAGMQPAKADNVIITGALILTFPYGRYLLQIQSAQSDGTSGSEWLETRGAANGARVSGDEADGDDGGY